MIVNVTADKSQNNSSYEYTVSGGRVIGTGAKVVWDMTDELPGTYQIRVDAEDKSSGRKWTETKTVKVEGNHCEGLCVCPTVSVTVPVSPVKAGETMTFTANVSGSGEMITYDWMISDGEIIEGQGTPVIVVATNAKMAKKTIKATIEIGGVCEECARTAEAVGSIAKAKSGKK